MNQSNKQTSEKQPAMPEKKPNDVGGFYFSSSVKITDPNTNEVLLQKRGDN